MAETTRNDRHAMKRHNHLWPAITSFENLLLAAYKARQGKRFRPNVLEFNHNLERNLLTLQTQLRDRTYQPGTYRTFEIFEPKPRIIAAAPYTDRVVHHALCNIIVPIFERGFIRDSYANRSGYGTHRALKRFAQFARSSRYVLQCDVQKYFPSIDRAILKSLIRRKIKCAETLWLIDGIIDNGNHVPIPIQHFPGDSLFTPLERSTGLPIGNLTSQFFANVYLNGLDHFVQDKLKVPKYLRYVDDFSLFGDDREHLAVARQSIETYLAGLRLVIHPIKSQLFETTCGANFVGFRVLPHRIRVRGDSLRRGRSRFRKNRSRVLLGRMSPDAWTRSTESWMAHLQHADSWRLRQRILAESEIRNQAKLAVG
jgi:retron-type reverse transcriptase